MLFRWAALSTLLIFTSLAVIASPRAAQAGPRKAAADALAAGQWAKALKLNRRHRDSHSRLLAAKALVELKKGKRALRVLRGLETRLPHLKDTVAFLRGEALLLRRRHLAAAKQFRLAITIPNSRWVDRAREARAFALLKGRRYRQAAQAFDRLIKGFEAHPRRHKLELGRAEAHYRSKRWHIAAPQLRHIWLHYPASASATKAQQLLSRIKARKRSRLKLAPFTLEELYERAKRLRHAKAYPATIEQLQAIAKAFPAMKHRVLRSIAYVQWKQQDPKAMLKTLRPLLKSDNAALRRSARRYATWALGWLGRLDEAYALFDPDMPRTDRDKMSGRELATLGDAAKFLAEHGRYQQALPLYRRLAQSLKWSRKTQRKLTWVAYRAGDYKTAMHGFATHYGNMPSFASYWAARTLEKQGKVEDARKLYRHIVERNLRSYYGHLARGHLIRAGEIKPEKKSCAHFRGPAKVELMKVIRPLRRKVGKLLPGLNRVESLWRSGLRRQARRELRVVLADYTWALYRNRRLTFRLRQYPLRQWRGSKATRKNWWGKRSAKLRRIRLELTPRLGQVAYAGGLDYFGWRLSPRDKNAVKRVFPRAFASLVRREAKRNQLDHNLIWAIMITESRYRPDVISRVNAGGLMQLMPNTAKRLAAELGLKDFRSEDVFEPEINLRLSMRYLKAVLDKFRGQVRLAAAAYNGGPHNLARWLTIRGKQAAADEFIEEIPFAESKRYAKKIIRMISQYQRTHCNKDDLVVSNTLVRDFLPLPNY